MLVAIGDGFGDGDGLKTGERILQEEEAPNPYAAPALTTQSATAVESDANDEFHLHKRRKLHQILAVMAIIGFVHGLLGEDSTIAVMAQFVGSLSVTFLILGWCVIDREERNLQRWRFFVPLMVLLPGPFIMIPIYLFGTRGLEGFVATAKALGFFILMSTVCGIGAIVGFLLSGSNG